MIYGIEVLQYDYNDWVTADGYGFFRNREDAVAALSVIRERTERDESDSRVIEVELH